MRRIFTVVLASLATTLMFSASALAQTSYKVIQPAAQAEAQAMVGGVPLNLPAPAGDFAEVGDNLRTFFDVLVAGGNRLLTAYMPPRDIESMSRGLGADRDVYAMVEVDKEAENISLSADEFRQIVSGLEPAMDAGDIGEAQQELNQRLNAPGSAPIELGHPRMLGRMFQKYDATGFAMLEGLKRGDFQTTMVAGFALLRVRQRVIFVYLFHKYDSPDSVQWVRTNLERWSDAILASNQ